MSKIGKNKLKLMENNDEDLDFYIKGYYERRYSQGYPVACAFVKLNESEISVCIDYLDNISNEVRKQLQVELENICYNINDIHNEAFDLEKYRVYQATDDIDEDETYEAIEDYGVRALIRDFGDDIDYFKGADYDHAGRLIEEMLIQVQNRYGIKEEDYTDDSDNLWSGDEDEEVNVNTADNDDTVYVNPEGLALYNRIKKLMTDPTREDLEYLYEKTYGELYNIFEKYIKTFILYNHSLDVPEMVIDEYNTWEKIDNTSYAVVLDDVSNTSTSLYGVIRDIDIFMEKIKGLINNSSESKDDDKTADVDDIWDGSELEESVGYDFFDEEFFEIGDNVLFKVGLDNSTELSGKVIDKKTIGGNYYYTIVSYVQSKNKNVTFINVDPISNEMKLEKLDESTTSACIATTPMPIGSKTIKRNKMKPVKSKKRQDVELFKEFVANDRPCTLRHKGIEIKYFENEGKKYMSFGNALLKTYNTNVMCEAVDRFIYEGIMPDNLLKGYSCYEMDILMESDVDTNNYQQEEHRTYYRQNNIHHYDTYALMNIFEDLNNNSLINITDDNDNDEDVQTPEEIEKENGLKLQLNNNTKVDVDDEDNDEIKIDQELVGFDEKTKKFVVKDNMGNITNVRASEIREKK